MIYVNCNSSYEITLGKQNRPQCYSSSKNSEKIFYQFSASGLSQQFLFYFILLVFFRYQYNFFQFSVMIFLCQNIKNIKYVFSIRVTYLYCVLSLFLSLLTFNFLLLLYVSTSHLVRSHVVCQFVCRDKYLIITVFSLFYAAHVSRECQFSRKKKK